MKTFSSRFAGPLALSVVLISCGGGGDGTPPVTVASVVITSPAAAPSFATLGRTAQFAAQARDAGNANVAGATITWTSSNNAAATVSASGLVTAVANGTSQIRAVSSTIQSAPVTVTVSQLPAQVVITPGTVSIGALGSTKQLAASVADTGGAPIPGSTVTWTRAGTGASATVSGTGLVTATGVGIGDTAVATVGVISGRAPIAVTQVVRFVTVSSTAATPDTLFAATRTRQFTAAATDSNANPIPGTVFAWTSGTTAVATVGAGTGLVTAVTDGSSNIQAGAGGVNGTRPIIVRRLVANHTISSGTGTISTAGGTLGVNGTVSDSAGVAIPMTWVSRSTGIATVSPTTGLATTITATGNGTTQIVYTVPARATGVDSLALTVSNQPTAQPTAAITVANNTFTSARNATVNPARDTVAVGGTVTWTWAAGAALHNVTSTGAPVFTSSANKATGTHVVTFNAAGTYTYECSIHGAPMSGTIVVK